MKLVHTHIDQQIALLIGVDGRQNPHVTLCTSVNQLKDACEKWRQPPQRLDALIRQSCQEELPIDTEFSMRHLQGAGARIIKDLHETGERIRTLGLLNRDAHVKINPGHALIYDDTPTQVLVLLYATPEGKRQLACLYTKRQLEAFLEKEHWLLETPQYRSRLLALKKQIPTSPYRNGESFILEGEYVKKLLANRLKYIQWFPENAAAFN